VLLDDAWWMLFWRLGFTTGLSSSVAEFYDSLLPLLLKKPLDAALVDTHTFAADTLCPLRTNERATLTGYRCVREAWMFYLHLHGVRAEETLHVHFNYQLQWLKLLLQDLHLVNEVDESDIFLARLGPAKLTHYCTKRITTAEHPRLLDEQLRLVQETVDGIEARLSVMKITNYGVTSQALSLAQDVYTSKSLHNQLGPHLLEGGHGDGPPRVVETRSRLAAAEVVALYFSAHWCPPCREFTPLLRQVYSNLIESGKPFEVVFISADKSEQEFDNYFADFPLDYHHDSDAVGSHSLRLRPQKLPPHLCLTGVVSSIPV
jgi:thiol-disulfide isomerase/thioredoxin